MYVKNLFIIFLQKYSFTNSHNNLNFLNEFPTEIRNSETNDQIVPKIIIDSTSSSDNSTNFLAESIDKDIMTSACSCLYNKKYYSNSNDQTVPKILALNESRKKLKSDKYVLNYAHDLYEYLIDNEKLSKKYYYKSNGKYSKKSGKNYKRKSIITNNKLFNNVKQCLHCNIIKNSIDKLLTDFTFLKKYQRINIIIKKHPKSSIIYKNNKLFKKLTNYKLRRIKTCKLSQKLKNEIKNFILKNQPIILEYEKYGSFLLFYNALKIENLSKDKLILYKIDRILIKLSLSHLKIFCVDFFINFKNYIKSNNNSKNKILEIRKIKINTNSYYSNIFLFQNISLVKKYENILKNNEKLFLNYENKIKEIINFVETKLDSVFLFFKRNSYLYEKSYCNFKNAFKLIFKKDVNYKPFNIIINYLILVFNDFINEIIQYFINYNNKVINFRSESNQFYDYFNDNITFYLVKVCFLDDLLKKSKIDNLFLKSICDGFLIYCSLFIEIIMQNKNYDLNDKRRKEIWFDYFKIRIFATIINKLLVEDLKDIDINNSLKNLYYCILLLDCDITEFDKIIKK